MKKYLILVIINIFISKSFSSNNENTNINKIFKNLEFIISNSSNKNQYFERTYNFVVDKINKEDVVISYDSNLSFSVFGSSAVLFNSNLTNKCKLLYGDFVLKAYQKYPNLVHAILIHEMQHIYDFYNNQGLFEISKNNCIEKTYFEVDALTMEALFLNNYVNETKNLSLIERFFIADFKNQLDNTYKLFNEVDINILHQIDNIKNKNITFDEAISEYQNIGNKLLNDFIIKEDIWENYCKLISIYTYVFYSKQVIHDISYNFSKIELTNENFNIENYPETNDIIKKMRIILNDNNDIFIHKNNTLKIIENYINSKII